MNKVSTISGTKWHYSKDGQKTLCGKVVSNGDDGTGDGCKTCIKRNPEKTQETDVTTARIDAIERRIAKKPRPVKTTDQQVNEILDLLVGLKPEEVELNDHTPTEDERPYAVIFTTKGKTPVHVSSHVTQEEAVTWAERENALYENLHGHNIVIDSKDIDKFCNPSKPAERPYAIILDRPDRGSAYVETHPTQNEALKTAKKLNDDRKLPGAYAVIDARDIDIFCSEALVPEIPCEIPDNLIDLMLHAHTMKARDMWKRICVKKYGILAVETALKNA